jgi:hypothetical protein
LETSIEENVLTEVTASPEAEPETEETENESPTEAENEDGVPDACAEIGRFFPGITEDAADAVCDLERYRQLRALGLSTEEAYRATARRRAADNRSHLSGAVGNAAPPRRGGISEQELRSVRELLGNVSDAEIRRLYKRVNA